MNEATLLIVAGLVLAPDPGRGRLTLATICSVPGCPHPALASGRGRCGGCRLSEAERGYGAGHRLDRVVNRPGARCEECGCTANLQRDHRVPASLGGGDDPANKRWLCSCVEHGCHARTGVKTHAGGRFVRQGVGGIETMDASDPLGNLRPSFNRLHNPDHDRQPAPPLVVA